ncbi:hypothetical protein MCOR27_007763 [Pyricularia oryzae]|nr:hypothetical protein MCOR26_008454 [Pyricularia oryzae]KAI6273704.1 hypothetical protein MCOR27_007763 [Pyricularia oryzae]KAI6320630.1 hypothetical protein MCOR30_008191 [Pyricularia oryzae]KAI6321669.1 hypothetical protein MCOR29_004979 [Pyricularia oryzae]KAI6349123.1 hypothetical protein MCOR28_001211 [Pyricularia oryzae]
MLLHVFFATAALLLASVSLCSPAACGPPPTHVRIGAVKVAGGKPVRGVHVSVGEPGQPLALAPTWAADGTLVHSTSSGCGEGWSAEACATLHGGAYNASASGSRAGDPSATVDRLALGTAAVIPAAPLSIAGDDHLAPSAMLGLGPNSTVLDALASAGKIASRTVGFWAGRGMGSKTAVDGGLTFGGYDRTRVVGKGFSERFTPGVRNCSSGLVVTIADIAVGLADGTNKSLFSKDDSKTSSLVACLDPSRKTLLSLPRKPYIDAWLDASKIDHSWVGRGDGWWYGNLVVPSSINLSLGDVTVTLGSGLTVRIANELLVQPHTFIDPATGDTQTDHSRSDVLMYPNEGPEADDTITLGQQFFAAAYLMVNQDARRFTLWEASSKEANAGRPDLVPVARDNSDTTTPLCPGKGQDVANKAREAEDGQSTRMSKGAVAGIAVGIVALLLSLAMLAFAVLRKQGRPRLRCCYTWPPPSAADSPDPKPADPSNSATVVHPHDGMARSVVLAQPRSDPGLHVEFRNWGLGIWDNQHQLALCELEAPLSPWHSGTVMDPKELEGSMPAFEMDGSSWVRRHSRRRICSV